MALPIRFPRSRRYRLLFALGVAVVFPALGFLVLPAVVGSQLEGRVSRELGRKISVEKVRVNPYALTVTVEGLSIAEADGRTPWLGWRRLHVDFDLLSSLRGEWVLSEVQLDGFQTRVAINRDGTFNFSDLLAKFAPAAPPAPKASAPAAAKPAEPGRPIRVVRIAVSDSRLEFRDESRAAPFATTVSGITLSVAELRSAGTLPTAFEFSAVTEAGESFRSKGTFVPEGLRVSAEAGVEGVMLPKYAPYYQPHLVGQLAAGKVGARVRFEGRLGGDKIQAAVSEGTVRLEGLRLLEVNRSEPAVELARLEVTGVTAGVFPLKARVGSVALEKGRIQVRREKDGGINLLAFAPPRPPAAAAPAVPGSASAAPPDVSVGEVTLKDFTIEVSDLAAPRPVNFAFANLAGSLRDFSLARPAPMPLQLGLSWPNHGRLSIEGQVGLEPVSAKLKLATDAIELLPLGPYLEQVVRARLTQGRLTTALEIEASLPASGPLPATVAGDVTIADLGVVDAARNEDLLAWKSVAIRGLRAATGAKTSASIGELSLVEPSVRIIVHEDRSLNLASVVPPAPPAAAQPAPAAAASSTAPAASAPEIEIGRITLEQAAFQFNDRSIQPHAQLGVRAITGAVTGLSSTKPGKGEIDLKAAVDGTGPVAISGRLDPLGPSKSVDLKLDLRNVELLPLSPYSGKFAGYEIARGKLGFEAAIQLADRKLVASPKLTLNQFTFGQTVQSPDATKLPVRLGVALLKDIGGRIVIDLPVSGSLDDPEFRIGQVVLRVIVNLLTKAAVSPFALLGSMFGGGEELAFQEFAPGLSDLQPSELKKLATLREALTKRPGLSLELEGGFDAAADAYALKRVLLAEQIRRAIWQKRHDADPATPPPEKLVISAEQTAAMIREKFNAAFPPGTKFGTPLPPPPAVVPPPPRPQGIIQRATSLLTGREARERRAAEQENLRRAEAHKQAVAAATAEGLPLAEMEGRLAEAVTVGENDLRALADARARRVRDQLIADGISAERLFLAQTENKEKPATGPRVRLNLQ